MKKILCPTDFSETAHNAVAYAAKLAHAAHSDLTLLNVQSVFDFSPAEIIQGRQPTAAAVEHELDVQCRAITKVFKVSCYPEIETTARPLSSVIREKARGYDLIVMGTNGPDDFYQFFAGSNTYNAIIKSETPLLLVPNEYTYGEIRHVVYAYDYLRERKLPLLKGLVPFVSALNARLTVLQVMEEAYSKEAEDDLKELQYIIRSYFGNAVKFEFDTIRSPKVAQSISGYVELKHADILALCSVHRNAIERLFHKSVIQHISGFSNVPVFVFHEVA